VARGLVKVVGALLLLALGACGGGCAGRRPAEEGAGVPGAAVPPPPLVATPVPPPVVPPELACTTDADCVSTPFPRSVDRAAACYCTVCPAPLAADAATANEAAWRARCGPEWEERARCEAPMCRRPPPVACREGACVAVGP
jgi:hypothetical protein